MRKPLVFIYILLFCLGFCENLQTQNLRFKQFTIDNGLPSNHIIKTVIDDKGFLWVESPEGISRFDGKQSKHWDWKDIPTIKDIDSLGQTITIKNQFLYGVHSNMVLSYELPQRLVGNDNIVWLNNGFITEGKQHLHSISSSGTHTLSLGKDSLFGERINTTDPLILDIHIDNYGQEDQAIVNINEKGFFTINISQDGKIQLKEIDNIRSSSKGIHPISPEEGIWYMDGNILTKWGKDFKPLRYPLEEKIDSVQHIISDGDNVYITDGSKLYMFELSSNALHFIHDDLHISSSINHLCLDQEDNLWVSTEKDGMYCIFNTPFTGYNIGVLGKTPIHHLYKTASLGLLAATDKGLYLISSGWSKIPLDTERPDCPVYHIDESENGIIYTSTAEGINLITEGNPSNCFPEEKNARQFFLQKNSQFFILKDNILHSYEGCGRSLKNKIEFEGLEGGINVLVQDDSLRFWIGTNDGIVLFDNNGKVLRTISKTDGLANSTINDLHLSVKNQLLIATDGGFSIMDTSNNHIENYTNLPSLKCRKIAAGKDGKIWVYSPNGIFSLDKENKTVVQTLGIPAEGVSCLGLGAMDRLWVGTPKGLLSFDTKREYKEDELPHLFWENIEMDSRLVELGEPLELSRKNILNVSYGTVAFNNRQQVSYQYRLNNNDVWQHTKSEDLSFSNLNPGKYNLQVRVQKPDSPWSQPLELSFQVMPPIWQRWQFLLPLALGLLLLTGLFFFNIRKREKKKIETRRRYAELELKALQSQMDPHFMFNTLNAIQHSILHGNATTASRSLNDFASLVRLFLESSKSKFITLKDEIKMLQLYCDLTRLCYDEKFDYTIKIDPSIDTDDVEIPSMLIQPHVENAIRHGLLPSENTGSLQIDFSLVKEVLTCSIKDDGIGRKKSAKIQQKSKIKGSSIGNTLTTERAAILNEIYHSNIRIQIKDLKGRKGNPLGTDVKIIIPLE